MIGLIEEISPYKVLWFLTFAHRDTSLKTWQLNPGLSRNVQRYTFIRLILCVWTKVGARGLAAQCGHHDP